METQFHPLHRVQSKLSYCHNKNIYYKLKKSKKKKLFLERVEIYSKCQI